MQTKLENSDLILLLPKDYGRVWNGEELYSEMYHAGNRRDIQMYQNLAGRSVGNIVISHIDQSDVMPFGDKYALIKEIHDTLDDDQGLIEAECGENPRGFEYIYSIIKTYHQEKLSANYCLHINIRNDEELIEVSGSFFEQFMTGERGSFALAMAKSAGIEDDPETHFPKGWFQDPYDPEYDKGCLMILGENRGFDGLFPADPLSQARELVLALTEDSYYKTREEIEKESAQKQKEEKKAERRVSRKQRRHKDDTDETVDTEALAEEIDDSRDEDADNEDDNILQRMFSGKAERAGAYKVDITENDKEDISEISERKRFSLRPADIADVAAKAAGDAVSAVKKTSAELDKVKVPFEVPDDFRNKLNQPIKEIPGWGKRKFIGFGKRTFGMGALIITWPVSESESMSLTDKDNIISNIRTEHVENQGLIDVKCGVTPKGNRYAYIIRKMYSTDEEGNRDWPVQYLLGMNIRIDGKIHFIDASFSPSEELGDIRRSAFDIMKCGSRDLKLAADEWERDPFDADIKEGFLMDWTEDEKYDELFPYSPLSELRSFVKYVTANN